jgi:hypothetical protein
MLDVPRHPGRRRLQAPGPGQVAGRCTPFHRPPRPVQCMPGQSGDKRTPATS